VNTNSSGGEKMGQSKAIALSIQKNGQLKVGQKKAFGDH